MADTPTVESPVVTPTAAGGSRTSSAPATAPAGTTVTHGTAGSALIRAAEAALKTETDASSASTQPGETKPGDTSSTAATGDGKPPAAKPEQTTGQQPTTTGAEGTPNPELEVRFKNVARNAQAKVLKALGLEGVTYADLPAVSKDLKLALGILKDLRTNAADFHKRLGAEISGSGGGGDDKPFEFPKGRLRAEDGTEAYSVDQIREIVGSLEQQITKKLLSNGALQNVISFVDEESERRQASSKQAKNRETVTSVLTEMRERPHFKENEKDILNIIAAWNESQPDVLRARGVAWAVAAAYTQVLNSKVYGPSYESSVEARVRDDMKKKAGGSTIVQPTGLGGDGKKPELTNVSQLAERMRQMEAAG